MRDRRYGVKNGCCDRGCGFSGGLWIAGARRPTVAQLTLDQHPTLGREPEPGRLAQPRPRFPTQQPLARQEQPALMQLRIAPVRGRRGLSLARHPVQWRASRRASRPATGRPCASGISPATSVRANGSPPGHSVAPERKRFSIDFAAVGAGYAGSTLPVMRGKTPRSCAYPLDRRERVATAAGEEHLTPAVPGGTGRALSPHTPALSRAHSRAADAERSPVRTGAALALAREKSLKPARQDRPRRRIRTAGLRTAAVLLQTGWRTALAALPAIACSVSGSPQTPTSHRSPAPPGYPRSSHHPRCLGRR